MSKEGAVAAMGAILALISAFIALRRCEGVMLALAVFAIVFGFVAVRRCSPDTAKLISSASALLLVSTILSVTVLEPEHFMDGEDPSTFWFVLIGFVHTIPLALLTLAVFSVLSAVFGASYNWVLVRGMGPFVAMGMEVPGFVLEYLFVGVDSWMTDNGYILYHFLVTGVVVAILAYLVSDTMRSRSLVLSNGHIRGIE